MVVIQEKEAAAAVVVAGGRIVKYWNFFACLRIRMLVTIIFGWIAVAVELQRF